jgi:hypothetical protein
MNVYETVYLWQLIYELEKKLQSNQITNSSSYNIKETSEILFGSKLQIIDL